MYVCVCVWYMCIYLLCVCVVCVYYGLSLSGVCVFMCVWCVYLSGMCSMSLFGVCACVFVCARAHAVCLSAVRVLCM